MADTDPNPNPIQVRDISNAIALGMEVGALLQANTENDRPKRWQHIGWDQIVDDVDRAAEALDRAQPPIDHAYPDAIIEFWEEHDWYLTLEAIAAELWMDPDLPWSGERMTKCLIYK